MKSSHAALWCGRIIGVVVLSAFGVHIQTAHAFPALARPALQVRVPERNFMQAAALSGQRVVAVGERGIVILSDDGARTWRQAQTVPVSTTLTAVCFVSEQMGWAVGHGGVILHTQDGGEHWSLQADGVGLAQAALKTAQAKVQLNSADSSAARELKAAQLLVADGADKPLLDVHFTDTRHGWVVGAYNLFFETHDGGATWSSVSPLLDNPKAFHLYAIRSSGHVVFVVGEQGQMHRSMDGGRTFQPQNSPYKGSWFALVVQPGGGVLAAGLRGNVFYSPDNGQAWHAVDGGEQVSWVSAVTRTDGSTVLANQGGHLFATRAGQPLSALSVPSMPPLAGLLELGADRMVALGAGGPIPLLVNPIAIK